MPRGVFPRKSSLGRAEGYVDAGKHPAVGGICGGGALLAKAAAADGKIISGRREITLRAADKFGNFGRLRGVNQLVGGRAPRQLILKSSYPASAHP